VAIITCGTGGYVYTYTTTSKLHHGQLCAVSFRNRLELGVVLGREETQHPGSRLLPLWPVTVPGHEHWGQLLCGLAELSASTPREVAGNLLFATPGSGLKLRLSLNNADALMPKLRSQVAALVGLLTPAKRKELMALKAWSELVELAGQGALGLDAILAGLPENTRLHTKLRKHYALDASSTRLLGTELDKEPVLPGSYLAGLHPGFDFPWNIAKREQVDDTAKPLPPPHDPALTWGVLDWPEDWALCQRWPNLKKVPLRRAQANWAQLRAPGGLIAELVGDLNTGSNTLVVAPMAWMLERIWPGLAPWAERVHRYHSDAGPSAAALALAALANPGQAVLGLAGAWKLAAYGSFDRILLLDPTHPGYEPQGDPWLDPRSALLLAAAQKGTALDMVEMGISAWDGANGLAQVGILPSFEPRGDATAAGGTTDLDPLPLELRQPGRRRLVYLNRRGHGRGLRCVECGTAVACPKCSAHSIYYSGNQSSYICPACHWRSPELYCRACGTANLAAQVVGIEALGIREGDVLMHGDTGHAVHPEHKSVLGTSQLLTPHTTPWPEDIIYIDAATHSGLVDSWPRELDMTARLRSLYANPELEHVYIVSGTLREKLGEVLTAAQLGQRYIQEQALLCLAGLPPYGCIYHFQLRGASANAVAAAASSLLAWLRPGEEDSVAKLGRPYRWREGFRQAGYVANPQVAHDDLQQKCQQLQGQRVSVFIRKRCGPWF